VIAFVLHGLINAGLVHDLPPFLQRKVQPTNVIILLLVFVVAIPFVFITLLFLPKELAWFPAMGGTICMGVWLMNYFGAIYYSRVIISILPICLAAIYNAYLCGPTEGPIPSLYLIELSFALIPFVIFDLNEKKFLYFTSFVCLVIVISFPITKNWFNIQADSSILRTGWLGSVTTFLAIVIEFGCIMGLAFLNKQAERSSEKLLKDMDEKNQSLKESEQVLKENLKKVEEAQIGEQKRNWASEGLAKIAHILQDTKNKDQVYDQLIGGLVTYMKANQGGIYVVDERETIQNSLLKLTSCYAYTRKKFIEQSYEAGQGLIGQAYLEKEYIYLTQVPADYIRITSGLGEATPRAILIMPLKVNDKVEGIIELASFNEFEDHQISFIEKVGENIASYIQNDRINEKTRLLLEESQHQAEMLRAQEEEMRQNLEELAATQEEMNRKENEYLRQIQDLQESLVKSKEN
jgi:GAF domain-containing protein